MLGASHPTCSMYGHFRGIKGAAGSQIVRNEAGVVCRRTRTGLLGTARDRGAPSSSQYA